MAVLTGRTRPVSLGASISLKPEGSGTFRAWGFQGSCGWQPFGVTREDDIFFPGPGVRYRYKATAAYQVQLQYPGGSATATYVQEWESDWILNTSYPPFVTWTITETISEGAWRAEGLLEEQYNGGTLRELWRHCSATVEGGGSMEWEVTSETPGTVIGTASGGATVSRQVTPGTVQTDYDIRWDLTTRDGVTDPLSLSGTVSCPGISYPSDSIACSRFVASLSGTVLAPTLHWNGSGAGFAVGQVTSSPLWALRASLDTYAYEDGAEVTPTIIHRYGSQTVETRSDGEFRFPAGDGYAYRATASVLASPSGPGVVPANLQNRLLFNTAPATGTNSGNTYALGDAWADEYGLYLYSSGGGGGDKFFGLFNTPLVDFATLRVEAVHRFRHFDSAAIWFGSAAVSWDGNLRIAGTANIFTTTPLKHFGYRFVRLRVKADVPATFTFRGESSTHRFLWGCTIEDADTWQDIELDLAYPDTILDSVGNLVTERFVVHPELFRTEGGMLLRMLTHTAAVYHFGGLEGFHKSEGDRTPLLLLYGQQTGDTQSAVNGSLDEFDTCDNDRVQFNIGLNLGGPGGNRFGRLVVNGVAGFDFVGSGSTVLQHWQGFRTALDDVTNDTGIHVTLLANPDAVAYGPEISAPRAYYTGGKPWAALTPGALFTVQVRGRSALQVSLANAQTASNVFGYFGMGTPYGSYGPEIALHGDKILGAELQGQVFKGRRALAGIPLELRRNDSEAVVAQAVTNDDGFYRLFGQYGVVRPFSNQPTTEVCSARRQYSGGVPNGFGGFDPPYDYTEQGKKLNAFWLYSPRLNPRDSEDYLYNVTYRRNVPLLNRVPHWQDWGGTPGRSIDLAESQLGWLIRAFVEDDEVRVEHSRDGGTTWDGGGFIASATAATRPALCVLPQDDWQVWVHGEAGATVYLSRNLGNAWTTYAPHGGLTYPRPAWWTTALVVAAFSGGSLRIYRSDDFGLTLTELATLAGVPPQLVSLRVDRNDYLHLVYAAEGTVYHRSSKNGSTWTPATALASGTEPGYALGVTTGLLTRFADDTQRIALTASDYAGPIAALNAPADTLDAGTLGVLVDRNERLWLAGYDGNGDLAMRWSSGGVTWDAPE